MIDWQRFKGQIDLNIFKDIYKHSLNIGQEKVLIVGDYGYQNRVLSPILTNAYALAARELGLNYSVLSQNAKARGEFADEVMIASLKRLPRRSVIIMNVSNRIGRLNSIGKSFRKFCNEREHRFLTSSSLGSLSNGSLKYVLRTMDVDYKKMNAKGEKIKNRLQYKAYRNRPLNERQKKFNKLVSKERYKVERTFGSMVRWFGAGIARYVGIEKMHTQHVMEAIAYNLYRSPGIVISKGLG